MWKRVCDYITKGLSIVLADVLSLHFVQMESEWLSMSQKHLALNKTLANQDAGRVLEVTKVHPRSCTTVV